MTKVFWPQFGTLNSPVIGWGGGGGGGAPAPWTGFEILNEAGAAPTVVPNLRFRPAATWQSQTDLTLTIVRGADGRSLEVTGWASEAALDAAIASGVHYEQELPGETNSARAEVAANLPALYFRRVGGPAPNNTTIPGMTVCATRLGSPVGGS